MTFDKDMILALLREANISPMDGESEVYYKIRTASHFCSIKVRIFSGASKICINFEGLPYVVKFVYETTEYDEAMEEAEIYAEAKKNNLDKFFPYTEYLETINNINYVVQEKISFDCYHTPAVNKNKYHNIGKTVSDVLCDKIEKDMNKVSGYNRDIDKAWIKMLVSLYGKKAVKSLCAFIQENNINDLHQANIGYLNDKPILLDFSGYHRD